MVFPNEDHKPREEKNHKTNKNTGFAMFSFLVGLLTVDMKACHHLHDEKQGLSHGEDLWITGRTRVG